MEGVQDRACVAESAPRTHPSALLEHRWLQPVTGKKEGKELLTRTSMHEAATQQSTEKKCAALHVTTCIMAMHICTKSGTSAHIRRDTH